MATPAVKRPNDPGSYERDYFAWTQDQARAVRERRLADLDFENIAEELESLGRSDKREIESRIKVILVHLLKWRHQPERRSTGWKGTLREQRHRVAKLIKESPSLRGHPASVVAEEYGFARLDASEETGLPIETFPELCPFRVEDVLDEDFLPEGER